MTDQVFTPFELVARVDSFPYPDDDISAYRDATKDYYAFYIRGLDTLMGLTHATKIQGYDWPTSDWTIDHVARSITFHPADMTFQGLTQAMHSTLHAFHLANHHPSLAYWSDELVSVVQPGSLTPVMNIDASGSEMLGLIGFGVHLIAWTTVAVPRDHHLDADSDADSDDGRRYWVPRRARSKMTYPGQLDSSVGGTQRAGETALACVAREAQEEAGLPEAYTRAHARQVDVLAWHLAVDDAGAPGSQLQVLHAYEMEVPPEMVLQPQNEDGEVEHFMLMSRRDVRAALARGEFKLNCAAVWVAMLLRHGWLTMEEEPRLAELAARLHRRAVFHHGR